MSNLSDFIDETVTDSPTVSSPESPKDNGLIDLQAFLSDYKEAAKIEVPAEQKQPTTAQAQPQTNEKFPGAPHWYGNPLYYQSGKKQGQLKPPPKNGNFKQAFQQPQVSVNPETSVITADAVISGAIFLTIINILIPMLFSLAHNFVVKDKRKHIEWEMLQMDEKATKQLETLADKALKHIKIDANPVGVLIVAMLGMYTMQFLTVKMMVDAGVKSKDEKK